MTVKDIIKTTATIIGREDIVEYLVAQVSNPKEQTVKAVDVMVRLLNLVINELACSFVPMVAEESVTATQGRVFYADLRNNPVKILGVRGDFGKDVLVDITTTYAVVSQPNVYIEYSFVPSSVDLEGQVCYTEMQVPSRILAYGLAAEYAVTEGCFKDAVMWHKRYADGIAEICAPKSAMIKRRIWS